MAYKSKYVKKEYPSEKQKSKAKFKYIPVTTPAQWDEKFHTLNVDGTITYHGDFKLVNSIGELEEFRDKCKGKIVAADSETTGVSYYKDYMVGFSLSLDDMSGIYVPLRHKIKQEVSSKKVDKVDEDGNVVLTKAGKPSKITVKEYKYYNSPYNINTKEYFDLLEEKKVLSQQVIGVGDYGSEEVTAEQQVILDRYNEVSRRLSKLYNKEIEDDNVKDDSENVRRALDLYYEILMNAQLVPMHNAEFDLMMLKAEGYDVKKIKTYDTMILAYLQDAEAKGHHGLKPASLLHLGRKMLEFPGEFHLTDLADPNTTIYPCSDTANTYGLFNKLHSEVKQLLNEYKDTISINGKKWNCIHADNKLIKAWVDYYAEAELYIDKEEARRYKEKVIEELSKLTKEIYDYFDIGCFNLSTSSIAFKEAMESKNIVTGAYTDSGAPSYGKKDGTRVWSKNLRDLKSIINLYENDTDDITEGFFNSNLNIRGNVNNYYLSKILETYGKEYLTVSFLNNNEFRILSRLKRKNKAGKNVKLVRGGRPLTRRFFIKILKCMLSKENEKLNMLKKIQQNSSMNKAVNSYIEKLTQVDTARMRYNYIRTASGRLASGNGAKNSKTRNEYYIGLNAQNQSKASSVYYKAYKSNSEGNILGWCFERVSNEYAQENKEKEIIVEGGDPNFSIRNCFIAPKGKVIISCDYSGQEMVLLANLALDGLLISNFQKGIDSHTATAIAIWGHSNKDLRKLAKTVNFAISYSGNEYTIAKNADITIDQAKEIFEKYCAAFWESTQWKQNEVAKMYKQGGVVYTIFGRPRRFGSYVNMAEKIRVEAEDERQGMRDANNLIAAAERRVPSHIIQGTAGDICRKLFLDFYELVFKHTDKRKECAFMSSIHDEMNFFVDEDKIIKYAKLIEDTMYFKLPEWPLPVKATIGVGYRFGQVFDFVWEDESRTKLIPKRV